MDPKALDRIKNDPNYKALLAERTSFGWTLAIITLVLYYGYITIVAFSPATIAIKLSGNITIGIVLGVGLILMSILLTGVYVLRANSRYDQLTQAIVQAATASGGRK
jgi:uncharacterized membrane protein (DUF485 family)